MNANLAKLLVRRCARVTSIAVRGKKITGPVVETPSYIWMGKKFQKQFFPYTETALLVNTNWRESLRRDFILRAMFYSTILIVFPAVYYVNSLINSPQNKAFWAAKRKADKEAMHKHEWDL